MIIKMEHFFNEIKAFVIAVLDYIFQPYIKEMKTKEEIRRRKKNRLRKINKVKSFVKKIFK
jgi:hypothetical protein